MVLEPKHRAKKKSLRVVAHGGLPPSFFSQSIPLVFLSMTTDRSRRHRFATLAEEKRQVESRARRLLRSDRYRGY